MGFRHLGAECWYQLTERLNGGVWGTANNSELRQSAGSRKDFPSEERRQKHGAVL